MTRLSLWSDLPCNDGILLHHLRDFEGGFVEALDGSAEARIVAPSTAEWLRDVRARQVVHAVLDDGTLQQWRVSADEASIGPDSASATVELEPTSFDLRDAGPIYQRVVGGGVRYAFSIVDETVAEVLTRLALPTLAGYGMDFVTLGTITPTMRITHQFDTWTVLQLCEFLRERTGYEFAYLPVGLDGYTLNFVHFGLDLPQARASQGLDIARFARGRERVDLATAVTMRGARGADGRRPALGRAVWRVADLETGIGGRGVLLEDRSLGPGPIVLAGQCVQSTPLGIPAHFLRLPDGELRQITASEPPGWVTLASYANLAVDDDCEIRLAQGSIVTEVSSPVGLGMFGRVHAYDDIDEVLGAGNLIRANPLGSEYSGDAPWRHHGWPEPTTPLPFLSEVGFGGPFVTRFLERVSGLPPGLVIPEGSMVQAITQGGMTPPPGTGVMSSLSRAYATVMASEVTADGNGVANVDLVGVLPVRIPGDMVVIHPPAIPDDWTDFPVLGGHPPTATIATTHAPFRRPVTSTVQSGAVSSTQRGARSVYLLVADGGDAAGVSPTLFAGGNPFEHANGNRNILRQVTISTSLTFLGGTVTLGAGIDVTVGDPVTIGTRGFEVGARLIRALRLTLSGLTSGVTFWPGDLVRVGVGEGQQQAMILNTVTVSGGEATVVLDRPVTCEATDPVSVTAPPFRATHSGHVTALFTTANKKGAIEFGAARIPYIADDTTLWASVALSVWSPHEFDITGSDETVLAYHFVPIIELVHETRGVVAFHELEPVQLPAGRMHEFFLRCPHTMLPEDDAAHFHIRVYGIGARNIAAAPFEGWPLHGSPVTFVRGAMLHLGVSPEQPLVAGSGGDCVLWQEGDMRLLERHFGSDEYRGTFREIAEQWDLDPPQPRLALGQVLRAMVHGLGVDLPLRIAKIARPWHDPEDAQVVLSTVIPTGPRRVVRALRREAPGGAGVAVAGGVTTIDTGDPTLPGGPGGPGVPGAPGAPGAPGGTGGRNVWLAPWGSPPTPTGTGDLWVVSDRDMVLQFRDGAWNIWRETSRGMLIEALNRGGPMGAVLAELQAQRRGWTTDDDGVPRLFVPGATEGDVVMVDANGLLMPVTPPWALP